MFYWLEDVNVNSSEDGYLAQCRITKNLLRNAESGNLIQYEIYHDPNTDEIYKIVSIEQSSDNLELVDYYYQGGVPNFAFAREDSVYDAIVAAPPVGAMEGYVVDTAGTPLEGVTVDILNAADSTLLYRGITASDGTFRSLTYLDGTECIVILRETINIMHISAYQGRTFFRVQS